MRYDDLEGYLRNLYITEKMTLKGVAEDLETNHGIMTSPQNVWLYLKKYNITR